jgi:AraC-like DNA-binding protein
MTFYHQEVLRIREATYPKEHLTRQVMRSKRFIDRQYARPLTLDEMATEAYLSKFHFLRVFKHNYGRTPHQYLISVRIARAKELLAAGASLKEACYCSGFESISSFGGLFRRQAGLPPHAYRQRILLKKSNFEESSMDRLSQIRLTK